MGMQKGYLTNINIVNQKIGQARREEIGENISKDSGFLPKGVLEEDIDQTLIEYLNDENGLGITIDGKKVPVIFLTIQRWSEFARTWQSSDKYKNIELPFVTVVRNPDIQQGQNQAGLWNIAGQQTYTYAKVPTWDGVRKGVDLYKIPQPTAIDITYGVRLFTNKMLDLNLYNRKIQKAFKSRQCYIFPNGHPMPLHLETIGDESNIDDFEERRFYIQMFEIKCLGYILDEADFEVVPTINRMLVMTELMEEKIYKNVVFEPCVDSGKATFTFVFKPTSEPQFSFTSQYDLNFTQLIGVEAISRIVISVNGGGVFDGLVMSNPIIIRTNDVVNIRVYKPFNSSGKFQLNGSS